MTLKRPDNYYKGPRVKGGGGIFVWEHQFWDKIDVPKQGPYMYQDFGEVSGPWRPTGSEPRPARP